MKFLLLLLLICTPFTWLGATPYDSIAVTINNKIITKNEIELRVIEESRTKKLNYPTAPEVKKIRAEITELLMEEALIDIRAEQLSINISDELLEGEIEKFRKQNNLSQVEFEDYLERQQISLAHFRKTYHQRYVRNRVIDMEVRPFIKLDERTLKSQYDKKQGSVLVLRARHILIRLTSDAKAAVVKKARNKILEIKGKIKAGMSFQAAADKFSEDPSVKNNHGDLGFFEREHMVKEFSNVAFSLPLKTLSDPVRTSFGFHLIEALETKRSAKKPFDKAKGRLSQQQYQTLFSKKYQSYIKGLKEKAQITIATP